MGLVFALPGNEKIAGAVARSAGWEMGQAKISRFPDGESYVRVDSDTAGEDAALVCTLARPDSRFLRTIFLARLLRELGARRVTLIAPYLAYLRQDARFRPGEALTSAHFALLVSREFDALITIAPHLHRYHVLSDVYGIPAAALNPGPLLAQWIGTHVPDPLLLGPDEESRQWVEGIAVGVDAPYALFRKHRQGDRDVDILAPNLEQFKGRQPVLVDDIISSGSTILAAARALAETGLGPPLYLVIHALCGRRVEVQLKEAGIRFVSTDTVPHASNQIPVAELLGAQLRSN